MTLKAWMKKDEKEWAWGTKNARKEKKSQQQDLAAHFHGLLSLSHGSYK